MFVLRVRNGADFLKSNNYNALYIDILILVDTYKVHLFCCMWFVHFDMFILINYIHCTLNKCIYNKYTYFIKIVVPHNQLFTVLSILLMS